MRWGCFRRVRWGELRRVDMHDCRPAIANRGRRACSHASFRLAARSLLPRETLTGLRENQKMDQATHHKIASFILAAEGLLDELLMSSKT